MLKADDFVLSPSNQGWQVEEIDISLPLLQQGDIEFFYPELLFF